MSRPSRGLLLIKIAAVLHLALTACGAAKYAPFPVDAWAGRAVECYQSYTGAGTSYGFFAPGVAAQRRVVWHGYNAQTNEWQGDSESGPSREAELRISTAAGLFSQEGPHDVLAASWTAWMFGKHPETSVSIIEVQAYVIPTMGEYRAGGQPRWLVVGAYSFARR
jgi:hypothetical protein